MPSSEIAKRPLLYRGLLQHDSFSIVVTLLKSIFYVVACFIKSVQDFFPFKDGLFRSDNRAGIFIKEIIIIAVIELCLKVQLLCDS